MTADRRQLALGSAFLLLLASCGGPGPQTSGPTPSDTASAGDPATAPTAAPTGSSPQTSATPSAPAKKVSTKPAVVHIQNYDYLPASPTVTVGQPIEIINDDTVAHTWSAAPGAGWAYTSGNLDPGHRTTFRGFTKAGRYRFLCYYHAEMPSMNGVVTVKAAP